MQSIACIVGSVSVRGAPLELSRFFSGNFAGWHSFWTFSDKGRSLRLKMADSSSSGSAKTVSVQGDRRQEDRHVTHHNTSSQGHQQMPECKPQQAHDNSRGRGNHDNSRDRGYHDNSGGKGYRYNSGGRGYQDNSGGRGYRDNSGGRGYRDNSRDRGYQDNSRDRGYHDNSGGKGYRYNSGGRGYRDNSGGRGYQDNSGGRGYRDNSGGRGYRDNSRDRGYQDNSRGRGYHDNSGGRGYHDNSGGRSRGSRSYDSQRGDGNYDRGGNWHGDGSGPQRAGPYPSHSRGSDNNDLIYLSKSLAWILRHAAGNQGFKFLPGGFLYVDDILRLPRFRGFAIPEVQKVVAENDKQRFALEKDKQSGKLMIRANQGHSVQVEGLALTPITIENADDYPQVIHGTYLKNWESIKKQGLCRMSRNHIHFAPGEPGMDGVISGMRKSCEVLIFLDLKTALRDGMEFFLSSNNVILSPGDKDGCIYPYYFEGVQQRSPRHKLDFDKSIKSKVVSAQEATDEHEANRKKRKKNKKKKKGTNVDTEDDEKEWKPPGGNKEGESSVEEEMGRTEGVGTGAEEGGAGAKEGGAGAKEEGSGAEEERPGTVESKGETAIRMDNVDQNKGDNPLLKEEGETDMEVDDADMTAGKQQDVSPQADVSGRTGYNEGDKPEGLESMEVDQNRETGVKDRGTNAEMKGTESKSKKKQAGAARDKNPPTVWQIDSVEKCEEAVQFFESIDTQGGENCLAVACFPDKAQHFSVIWASDVYKNIYIFDLVKCPELLSENQPLFLLIQDNKNIMKILHNCIPTCKVLFKEYEICVTHAKLCDVQTMYEVLAKKPDNSLDPGASNFLSDIAQQLSCSDACIPGDEQIDWTQRPLTDDMDPVIKTTLMTLMDVYRKMLEKGPDKEWKRLMYERMKSEIDSEAEVALYEKRKKEEKGKKKSTTAPEANKPTVQKSKSKGKNKGKSKK
ncbi:uncharacterized protein LOC135468616 isoform X2 [Liolophura sinensis]|uniref:uncharacterized protein LOC135468616 isoform X2 n=1 Tax=Liolophura sinensis TaxID=3198878 RepID=UPI0031594F5F